MRIAGVLAGVALALGACSGPPACDSRAVTNEFVDTLYSRATSNVSEYARFLAGEKPFWAVNYEYPPTWHQPDYDKLLAYLQSIAPAYRKRLNMPHYELWAGHYRLIDRAVSTTLKNIQELPRDPQKPHQARCRAGVAIQPKGRTDGGVAFPAVYTAQWYAPKQRGGSVMVVRIREAGNPETPPWPAPFLARRQSPANFAVEKLVGVLATALNPK